MRSSPLSKTGVLPPSFYERGTVTVARELLGKLLVHHTPEGLTSGKIVEVEAYLGENDPGSHASRGVTPRNKIMFGKPGLAYIYFIYGNHFLFNVVTQPEGRAGAVLIRALEPVEGIELMQKRRECQDLSNLTNGPGKLTQAFNITKEQNGSDLTNGNLKILNKGKEKFDIISSTRIGIKEGSQSHLRFYMAGNKFVSKISPPAILPGGSPYGGNFVSQNSLLPLKGNQIIPLNTAVRQCRKATPIRIGKFIPSYVTRNER